MKVLDLGCSFDHVFEGWFASEDDFQSQKARALVQCPVCGATAIEKRLSAPRLNLGAPASPSTPAATSASDLPAPASSAAAAPSREALLGAWLQMSRQVLTQTEDVGPRFAEEARRMHYGETATRGIRGQASVQEAVALQEEGIEVLPLALPQVAKQTLQ